MKDNTKLIILTFLGLAIAIADGQLRRESQQPQSQNYSDSKIKSDQKQRLDKLKEKFEKLIENDNQSSDRQLTARPSTRINSWLTELIDESPSVAEEISRPVFNGEQFVESSQENPTNLMRDAESSIDRITGCMGIQLCGLEGTLRNNDRGYFDPYNTPLHDTLNNALAVIDSIDKQGIGPKPNMETLLNAMRVQHGEIPMRALRIVLGQHPSEIPFDVIYRIGHTHMGQIKGHFFGMIAENRLDIVKPDEYSQFKMQLEKVLSDKNDPQATLVARTYLNSMKLDNQEFVSLHRASCHYLQGAGTESTRYFSREFERQAMNRQLQLSTSQLCSGP